MGCLQSARLAGGHITAASLEVPFPERPPQPLHSSIIDSYIVTAMAAMTERERPSMPGPEPECTTRKAPVKLDSPCSPTQLRRSQRLKVRLRHYTYIHLQLYKEVVKKSSNYDSAHCRVHACM